MDKPLTSRRNAASTDHPQRQRTRQEKQQSDGRSKVPKSSSSNSDNRSNPNSSVPDVNAALETQFKTRLQEQQKQQNDPHSSKSVDGDEWVSGNFEPLVGTSTVIEKDYFRLTSPPLPSTVRPENILILAFAHAKKQYAIRKDYEWVCNQLKSIRQDLVVQHLRNSFTVRIYEYHARVAIEALDFSELTTVLSTLLSLYKELESKVPSITNSTTSRLKSNRTNEIATEMEMIAYHICLQCHYLQPSSLSMLSFLQQLSQKQQDHKYVAYSLNLRSAFLHRDFVSYFHMLSSSPLPLIHRLLSVLTDSVRIYACKVICKAYQTVLLEWITPMLGWENQEDAQDWIQSKDLKFQDKDISTKLDVRASMQSLQNLPCSLQAPIPPPPPLYSSPPSHPASRNVPEEVLNSTSISDKFASTLHVSTISLTSSTVISTPQGQNHRKRVANVNVEDLVNSKNASSSRLKDLSKMRSDLETSENASPIIVSQTESPQPTDVKSPAETNGCIKKTRRRRRRSRRSSTNSSTNIAGDSTP